MISTAPSTRKCSDHMSPLASSNRMIITPQKKQIVKSNLDKKETSFDMQSHKKLELSSDCIHFAMLKSRGLNSNAGLTCTRLQNGIEGMFTKPEEKKQRYFQRVEELRNKKLDIFVLM